MPSLTRAILAARPARGETSGAGPSAGVVAGAPADQRSPICLPAPDVSARGGKDVEAAEERTAK